MKKSQLVKIQVFSSSCFCADIWWLPSSSYNWLSVLKIETQGDQGKKLSISPWCLSGSDVLFFGPRWFFNPLQWPRLCFHIIPVTLHFIVVFTRRFHHLNDSKGPGGWPHVVLTCFSAVCQVLKRTCGTMYCSIFLISWLGFHDMNPPKSWSPLLSCKLSNVNMTSPDHSLWQCGTCPLMSMAFVDQHCLHLVSSHFQI